MAVVVKGLTFPFHFVILSVLLSKYCRFLKGKTFLYLLNPFKSIVCISVIVINVCLCTFSVVSEQGVRGLYRGYRSTVLREVRSVQFFSPSLTFYLSWSVFHPLVIVITTNNTSSKSYHTLMSVFGEV